MLGKRLLAGTSMFLLFVAAMWLDLKVFHDGLLFHVIFLVGALLSFREFWPICRAAGHQTFSAWATFSGCGLVVVHYFSMRLASYPAGATAAEAAAALELAANLLMGGLVVAIFGVFFLSAYHNRKDASLDGIAVTCLGILYIFFLPSFLIKLRYLRPDGLLGGPAEGPEGWNTFGHNMVIATIVLAKGCDVWAYLVGRLVGRHKLIPRISPGKTIEGVAGGLVGCVLTALVLRLPAIGVLSGFSPAKACVLGLCLGCASILGDLSESMLKRSAGAKDSGRVVPGYGGALDVVDSLMVAGPVAYFLIPAII